MKAAMFGWDLMLPVDFYSDTSNFAAGCYITQTQDGEARPLVYDSFTLSPAERSYDTYRRELAAIVKCTNKYSHMLIADQQSVVHTDHKPVVEFINAKYHEGILARWANKLRLFHIRIQHILGKKNTVADGLSRIIFNNTDCTPARLVHKLAKKVCLHQNDNEWFWKLGIGDYGRMLMQLITEDQAIRIQRYGEKAISTFLVGWTLFHRDPGKLVERWRGPFIIDGFGGDHGASYTLKTLDGKSAPNTHHGDHLRIFRPREGYLRPADEEPLKVTRNLRFRRGKDWSARDLVFLFVAIVSPGSISLHVASITIKCGADASGISYLSPLGAADLSKGEL